MSDPLEGPLTVLADELGGVDPAGADVDQLALDDGLDGLDDLEDETFDPAAVEERNPRTARKRRGNQAGRQDEGQFTTEVLNHLVARPDTFAVKVHGTAAGGPGNLDIDGCIRLTSGIGRAFKIELKVGSNKPTPVQKRRLRQWQEMGALVGWARDLVEFEQILAHAEDPLYRWTGPPGAPPVTDERTTS